MNKDKTNITAPSNYESLMAVAAKMSKKLDFDDLKVEMKFPTDIYPDPVVFPPSEHPRVMFRAEDVEIIRKNIEHAESFHARKEFYKMKDVSFDGILPESFDAREEFYKTKGLTMSKIPPVSKDATYDPYLLAVIEAKAFDYAIFENVENGKAAVMAIKNFAKTCTYEGIFMYSRPMGHVLFTVAEVYDWCYPLLTMQDKEEMINMCYIIGSRMEIGCPPIEQGAVCCHGCEAQLMRDWLSLAIAVFDEYPEIYHLVGGRFFSEFVEARNFWFVSETQHQGISYGPYRYGWDLWAQWLIYRMGGYVVYVPETGKVIHTWMYMRRSDGEILREGDVFDDGHYYKNTYWGNMVVPVFYAANFYKDPVLKEEFYKEGGDGKFVYNNQTLTPVQFLAFNDPDISRDAKPLPLAKYCASPCGEIIAHTGWSMGKDSADVLAFMKISEVSALSHHHRDAGNFQIYYKGILASESGLYKWYESDHDENYYKESIAHNTLLIGSEMSPDGCQRIPNPEGGYPKTMSNWMANDECVTGKVLGHEIDFEQQSLKYAYLMGDIAAAYYDNVKEALHSMLFLPLEDEEYPAVFFVFDKIVTSDVGKVKKFVLHMQTEPEVNGNVSVIKNTLDGNNGMLTCQTLLPVEPQIVKIGGEGRECWANGKNHPMTELEYSFYNNIDMLNLEMGWGRIEISPEKTGETDYFLHVMYVNDANKQLPLQKANLIDTDTVAGAKIFNRVAIFNKNKKRIKDKICFMAPGEEMLQVSVAGVAAGMWRISVNKKEIGSEMASDEGGILNFTAPAGEYELTYIEYPYEKK